MTASEPTQDPVESAEEAGLRYVTDASPGIRRRRAGRGFSYIGPDGQRVTNKDQVAWIRSLAIPPAWTDVWICTSPTRPPAGHRARRARPQAVPLPPRLARGARRGQVRPHDRLRPGAARHPAPRGCRPAQARPAARARAGGRGSAAGEDADAGRQRGIRPRQPLLRTDHAARPPCRGRQQPDPVPLPEQGRQGQRRGALGCAPGADRGALPGAPGAGAVRLPRRGRRGADHRLERRERLPARDHRPGLHRQGLPDLVGHGAGRLGAEGARRRRLRGRRPSATWCAPSSRSPSGWATRRPSRAGRTCTRR